jgi:hypothetical protein
MLVVPVNLVEERNNACELGYFLIKPPVIVRVSEISESIHQQDELTRRME